MAMDTWIPIAASVLGGGAVGALITAGITSFRNRIQPIGYRIDAITLFAGSHANENFQVKITISDAASVREFANLHVLDVRIVNRGNLDWKSFEFGIAMPSGHHLVHIDPIGVDRHHKVEQTNLSRMSDGRVGLDFVISPFNRRDVATITIFITLDGGIAQASMPNFSSPEPVRFGPMPSVVEALQATATSIATNMVMDMLKKAGLS
jgi:hypothetical protein